VRRGPLPPAQGPAHASAGSRRPRGSDGPPVRAAGGIRCPRIPQSCDGDPSAGDPRGGLPARRFASRVGRAALRPGVPEPCDGGVLLRGSADDLEWYARELMRLPFRFEARAPAELRRTLAKLASEI